MLEDPKPHSAATASQAQQHTVTGLQQKRTADVTPGSASIDTGKKFYSATASDSPVAKAKQSSDPVTPPKPSLVDATQPLWPSTPVPVALPLDNARSPIPSPSLGESGIFEHGAAGNSPEHEAAEGRVLDWTAQRRPDGKHATGRPPTDLTDLFCCPL